MFQVYHSNQLELLKELIAHLMENEPLSHPFEQEIILVQSPGMSQWLQIELAKRFGIAANIYYPLPATFIWDMFRRVLPDIPKESAYTKQAMTWKLMKILPEVIDEDEFEPLRHYLHNDLDKRKLHQLAGRVADLFDQYLVYRPQWIEKWQQNELIDGLGTNQLWQKRLWLRLVAYTDSLGQSPWHRANLYQSFIDKLSTTQGVRDALPKRIFICGISSLPPVYLQALNAIAEHTDIHLMFTNPCRYYWGDIHSHAFLAKLQKRKLHHYIDKHEISRFKIDEHAQGLFNAEGEQELANPLLASWGKLGRDNLYFISQIDGANEISAFVDTARSCLLEHLQQDILDLENHAQLGTTLTDYNTSQNKRVLTLSDQSVTFHSCHSAQREVEVLQDKLLALFEQDPSLTPRDIIVMVSDIDSYTPFIQAVFGNTASKRYIPFSISDRKALQAHPILQAFILLLDLPQSRFSTEQVLTLLEVSAFAARFDIDERELGLLRRWVNESGIRWGLDDDNVRALSLPVIGQNTWEFGLSRMLLGYAMDSRYGPWHDVLPYDESSGLAAQLAGKLALLVNTLKEWRTLLDVERTLDEWKEVCQQLIDSFFHVDGDAELVLTLVTEQWHKIIQNAQGSGYDEQVPLRLIRDELAVCFDEEKISQRFLAGAINFCTLMPMRSVPFKVVCLLGMNDGIYPRTIPPLGFDLMAEKPARGDRKRRDDDRYLFLEALNSAAQQLYISYIGLSIQDNQVCNPSVLVTELLDYICQSFCLEGDEALNIDDSAIKLKEHLVFQHNRVPFAKENFIANSPYQSFASEWLPAAKTTFQGNKSFISTLDEREPVTDISIEQLLRFYRHPIRAFFQQRLKIHFTIEETELPEDEPFILDRLQRYKVNERLLALLIKDENPAPLYQALRAAGQLPAKQFGQLFWEQQVKDIAPLAEKIKEQNTQLFDHVIDIQINGIKINGVLKNIHEKGVLRYRPAYLTANDGVQLWVEHLLFNFAIAEGESIALGRENSIWHFSSVKQDDAKKYLEQLITGYCDGLNSPLLLLNQSGWNWLSACFDKKSKQYDFVSEEIQQKALSALMQSLQGSSMKRGEMEDDYVLRVCRNIDQNLIQALLENTQRYLLPMAEHLK
ncbi:exodeoxyribonuclease V subunit gamma [Providencia stuartii]|uniref:exodeoxyribonuclease V subunit gamma n=1 Tax=Providencia stuartii TaxID=588 RepID=UPI0018C6B986|nr:exodeoxyribonuclease V subunit gamma [Providencia stuartii]EMD1718814.1 exodeoxyribonuclease V subunit gamma [Providencia stuartii]MBG5909466.1 exodeoxyribonuclease V subunit gamma [Providencia stuartii]WAZ74096.1 exodeoxyribonuclease V subunit gamma [Providencia stuartii]HAU5734117.1 exodeoxyribonuclease V subunit gamma [Providencia stuartii]HAU5776170.1 exodeoxyribonuclease V subunit gamma [Providencia stuartii]